jgi:agmatine deiminase
MLATPRDDGLWMPAEWGDHECCLMAWPTRRSLWGDRFDEAKRDYASIASVISGFEPVVMVCNPGDAPDVAKYCGSSVNVEEIEINDSWMRDSGPTIVTDGSGRRAVVQLGFNGWGEKYLPYDKDARVATALARVFDLPVYEAPILSEGGAFYVDGEGTLITTEGSVLNPNRNPGMSKAQAERILRDYLGAERVIWLQAYPDRDTDGHVDGIAQYVKPGVIALQVVSDRADVQHRYSVENLRRLEESRDAADRQLNVLPVEPVGYVTVDGEEYDIPYLNFYLANGAVIAPVGDRRSDDAALARLAEIFPEREVVGVPGELLSVGGGGPHCITQQVPR